MPSATSPTPALLPGAPSPSSQPTDIPPFPTASTFSILPDLYILLSRLAPLQNQPNGGADTLLHLVPSNEPALQTSDIVTAMYPIRQKIQKAIAAIKALPDISRSMEEQEEEMRHLEARIGALEGRLGELGVIAEKSGKRDVGDVVMKGVEGAG